MDQQGMASPPESPSPVRDLQRPRPMSVVNGNARSMSRMSMSSRIAGSRMSDEDGKTSVRVAVRVRPPLGPADPGYELIPQRFQRSMVQVTTPTSLAIDSPQGRKLFVFDRVFGEDVDQQGVWDYIQESVETFCQGYNVSVLAYGQSGAGKSYTMGTSGPAEQNDVRVMGVIPRAARILFDKLQRPDLTARQSSGLRQPSQRFSQVISPTKKPVEKEWTMRATYVEIYQEQLRDLLLPDTMPMQDRPSIQIREDPKGRILLTGLHQVEISSIDDLLRALNSGSSIRQTDATAINARSSRSHAVFSLNLIQKKHGLDANGNVRDKRMSVPVEMLSGAESYITVDSKLHFVDLAGSERLKNTQAQGERAREGISINAGLASLGKVISQLSSRSAGSHVSYRDSKLTRLLQDSLGGNAITYMIACVTPAEFHLSETLNTVQYAQRARAIQSKPRIQQVDEEGNRQAVIDRLRAEVSFLREQIKQSQGGDRRSQAHSDRGDRSNEREMELHHQLLDVQENYGALSQRHAKLIADVARLRESPDDQSPVDGSPRETPAERTKRSIAFAETVEQVVLEYEKTIQSLEGLLSNTRTSLANTDASLLERESKLTYAETVNAQLQSRIQKIMDRESNNEAYLHQLEQQLEGHHSGEDRNTTVVNQLRKELTRIRDNEANAEDYISTLEERLAETDQDAELMQREIERLEHVVERQRSLGKLDNLLFELDHISQEGGHVNGTGKSVASATPGSSQTPYLAAPRQRDQLQRTSTDASIQTNSSFRSATGSIDHSLDGSEAEPMPGSFVEETDPTTPTAPSYSKEATAKPRSLKMAKQSEEQSAFVADKLETVSQELFDLRIEHESVAKEHQATVSELDVMQSKYEKAMAALAELQEVVDDARQTPRALSSGSMATHEVPFFGGAGMMKGTAVGLEGHPSSSQSLSSELSLAGESSTSIDNSDSGTTVPSREISSHDVVRGNPQALSAELEAMRELQTQRDEQLKELAAHHEALQHEHSETLDVVEELKTEIAKASMLKSPSSPREPITRRTSAQSNANLDKAHRSFAAIKRIVGDKLERDNDTDAMQNLELNLNTAMHELHARQEKIQALENDVTNTRREMESKTQLITGLTRERTSLSASPIDISVMSNFRDQLAASETQYKMLQESTAQRESELLAEIATMRAAIETSGQGAAKQASDMVSLHQKQNELQDHQVGQLQEQLALAEKRHQAVLDAKQASDKQLMATITELEAAMTHVENLRKEASDRSLQGHSQDPVVEESDAEKVQHQRSLSRLETELAHHKAVANQTSQKVNGLVTSHARAKDQIQEATHAKAQADSDLGSLEQLVATLESQLAEFQGTREGHQKTITDMQERHDENVERAKSDARDEMYDEHRARLADHSARHQEAIRDVNHQLADSREALNEMQENLHRVEAALHEKETLVEQLQATIQEQKEKSLHAEGIGRALQQEIEATKAQADQHLLTIADLRKQHEKATGSLTALHRRDQERSRIVEELETELSSTFDQHQDVKSKVAALQAERANFLEEEQRKDQMLENVRAEIADLQARLDGSASSPDQTLSRSRANSMARKSASAASLPSPPPNAPLPPLPSTMPTAAITPTSPTALTAALSTLPAITHSRRPSRDLSLERADHKAKVEEYENRIRTVERNLYAEKSLVTTLEEALEELESSSKRSEADRDDWKKRVWGLEEENNLLKQRERERTLRDSQQSTLTQSTMRQSIVGGMNGVGGAGVLGNGSGSSGVNGISGIAGRESWSPGIGGPGGSGGEAAQREEKAQKVQRDLESRMNALNQKKKKKSSLACF